MPLASAFFRPDVCRLTASISPTPPPLSLSHTRSITYIMGGLVAVVVCTIASFVSFHYATYDGSAIRGGRLLDAQGNVAATATASRNVNLDSLLSSVAASSAARMLRHLHDVGGGAAAVGL